MSTQTMTPETKATPTPAPVTESSTPSATTPADKVDVRSVDDDWRTAVDRLFDWPERLFRRPRTERFPALMNWPDRAWPGWMTAMDRLFDVPMHAEPDFRVEETLKDGEYVVRADLPGIDPDRDVDITIDEGRLRIHAERRSEVKDEEKGRHRTEVRYGSFTRVMPAPLGLSENDIKATYKDGVLEVRVPAPEPERKQTKVSVQRA